jgi:hypothetical protein
MVRPRYTIPHERNRSSFLSRFRTNHPQTGPCPAFRHRIVRRKAWPSCQEETGYERIGPRTDRSRAKEALGSVEEGQQSRVTVFPESWL